MKINYYDVYKKDGTKYLSQKTSRELSAELGIALGSVSRCAELGRYYKGKYKIVKNENGTKEKIHPFQK